MSFKRLFNGLNFGFYDTGQSSSRDAEATVGSKEEFPPLTVKVNGFMEDRGDSMDAKLNEESTEVKQELTPARPVSNPPFSDAEASFQSPRRKKVSAKGRKTIKKDADTVLSPTASDMKRKGPVESPPSPPAANSASLPPDNGLTNSPRSNVKKQRRKQSAQKVEEVTPNKTNAVKNSTPNTLSSVKKKNSPRASITSSTTDNINAVNISSATPQQAIKQHQERENSETENKILQYSLNRKKLGLSQLKGGTNPMKRGLAQLVSSGNRVSQEDLKRAAWKLKYCVELWRHKVDKQRFAAFRKKLMAQVEVSVAKLKKEQEGLQQIKLRESTDSQNFENFRIALEKSGEIQRNEFDNEPQAESPFLRAIMRQHTLEAEKFAPAKKSLEEAQKELQAIVIQKSMLDTKIFNEEQQKATDYRGIASALTKGLGIIDSSMSVLNKSISDTHRKYRQKTETCKFKLKAISQSTFERRKQLEICGHEAEKLQQVLQKHVEDHLELRTLDDACRSLAHEITEMKSKLEMATMDIERLDRQKVKIRKQEEKTNHSRENLDMQMEEYRGRIVAAHLKNEHSTQYTKFLENQLGEQRRQLRDRPATVGSFAGKVSAGSAGIVEVGGDSKDNGKHMTTPMLTRLVNNTIVVLDDTGSKLEEDKIDNPKPDGVIMKLKQRLYDDYVEDMDESALSARKIVNIEQKLKTMASSIDEKMKSIDKDRLLMNQDQVMELSRVREEKDRQFKKLSEERTLWTTVHRNLEDRKLFMLDQTSSIRSSLASARNDIKSFHDSRSMMTKAISEWEIEFLQEKGRHATPEESEKSVGYLYEMLDKLQYDLQERMTMVMELSAKFRAYQQELQEIEEPLEVSRERSVRGMSPLPRQVPEKFVMIDERAVREEMFMPAVFKKSPRPDGTPASPKNSNHNTSATPEKIVSGGSNSAFTPLVDPKPTPIAVDTTVVSTKASSKEPQGDLHKHLPTLHNTPFAQRPLTGFEPPARTTVSTPRDDGHYIDSHNNLHVQRAVEEAESKLQQEKQSSNDSKQPIATTLMALDNTKSPIHAALFGPQNEEATPAREANLLRNRNFDEDVKKVIDDKKLFGFIGINLEIKKKKHLEQFYKMKEQLSSSREDIKVLQEEKKVAKLSLAQWRRQWKESKGIEPSKGEINIHSKEYHVANDLEGKIMNKLTEMNQYSSTMLDLKQEMDEIDYYIKIAHDRSTRGVSRENRRFPDKYIDLTEPPADHHSTMFQPVSTPELAPKRTESSAQSGRSSAVTVVRSAA